MLRLTDVRVNQIARDNIQKVLDSGQLAQGPMVAQLEGRVAALAGTDHAVAVSSGTAALTLLLVASGFKPDDEVAIPAFSFAATANVPVALGAHLRFVDVDDRLLMPLTDAQWTVPVHLYGQKAPTAVGAVEDACQAIGQPLTHAAISFYGSKTGGCGEGGMVVTNDPEVALKCRLWRSHGSVETYEHLGFGWNYRMSDLSAAVALGQLETIETTLALRKRNARLLTERLTGLPVDLPGDGTFHQYVIEVDRRDEIRVVLADCGIESRPIYPYALPDLPHLPDADVPRARQAAARNLALPVHEHLTADDIGYIADVVEYAIRCVA